MKNHHIDSSDVEFLLPLTVITSSSHASANTCTSPRHSQKGFLGWRSGMPLGLGCHTNSPLPYQKPKYTYSARSNFFPSQKTKAAHDKPDSPSSQNQLAQHVLLSPLRRTTGNTFSVLANRSSLSLKLLHVLLRDILHSEETLYSQSSYSCNPNDGIVSCL